MLDTIDTQKSALEHQLREVSDARNKEHQLNVTQLKVKNSTIQKLETDMENAMASNANVEEQLSTARDDIIALSVRGAIAVCYREPVLLRAIEVGLVEG